jgi:hypothetical protein
MGSWGNTSSTSKAALSAIRRAPQLGQNPRNRARNTELLELHYLFQEVNLGKS